MTKKSHQIKTPKLYRIKNKKTIEYLEQTENELLNEGYNGGVVDDHYIDTSFNVNDYMFYKAKDDSFWATRSDKIKISNERKLVDSLHNTPPLLIK